METAIAATKVDFVSLAYDTEEGTAKVRITKEAPNLIYISTSFYLET